MKPLLGDILLVAVMNAYLDLPLDAVLALGRQKYDELLAIRSFERLVSGDRGNRAQASTVEKLLTDLHAIVLRVRSDLSAQIRNDQSPLLTLSPSHSEFLTQQLLPNARNIEKAYFHGDILAELIEDDEDLASLPSAATIKNAIWFTAEYTNTLMDQDDKRQLKADMVFEIVDQPWFQPDAWSANLRSLRPIVVGVESTSIPTRIRARLSEVHRAFTFGAWMATIALCRAVVEFALAERASHFGYPSTVLARDGSQSFLTLEKLIQAATKVIPDLQPDLELLQETGNRILHPKRKRNVIPLPKVLRSEAYGCVQSVTKIVELLYGRQSKHDG